jgi:hypothetical protein
MQNFYSEITVGRCCPRTAWLDEVSTTRGSGWVRSRQELQNYDYRTNALANAILLRANGLSGYFRLL